MLIYLHKHIIFNQKFYPEALLLRQNENCDKTANTTNHTIFSSITTFIPLWYPEVNPFEPFFIPFFTIHSSTILQKKNAQIVRDSTFFKYTWNWSWFGHQPDNSWVLTVPNIRQFIYTIHNIILSKSIDEWLMHLLKVNLATSLCST